MIQIIYYICICTGALLAGLYWVVRIPKHCRNDWRIWGVLGLCLVVGGIFGFFCGYFSSEIPRDFLGYLTEYYLVSSVFLVVCTICFGDQKLLATATQSVVIFSVVARIGCLVAGCCGGRTVLGFAVPIVPLEMLFGAIMLVLLLRLNPAQPTLIYLGAYGAFRFLTEFLRTNTFVRTIAGLNIRQYVALAILVYLAVFASIQYRSKKCTKK